MAEEETDQETILIKITDSDVDYESELSFVEVVFWLEVLQNMMMDRFING